MTDRIALAELNDMPAGLFVQTLADIFEHSPWVADGAVAGRPYATVEKLHGAMVGVMRAAPAMQQLGLIRAHPDLAGRLALAGDLTPSSNSEQASAGLDQCSPEELTRFQSLNERYKKRFGFPFIMAVKGKSRADILAAFERRIGHDKDTEFDTALGQIARIAELRLQDLIAQ